MTAREKWFWHKPFPKVDGLALLPYLTHNTSLQASVVRGGQPEKMERSKYISFPKLLLGEISRYHQNEKEPTSSIFIFIFSFFFSF